MLKVKKNMDIINTNVLKNFSFEVLEAFIEVLLFIFLFTLYLVFLAFKVT